MAQPSLFLPVTHVQSKYAHYVFLFIRLSSSFSLSQRGEEGDLHPPIHPLGCGAQKPEANAVSIVILSWLVFLVAQEVRGGNRLYMEVT